MTLNKPKIFRDIDTINTQLGEKANKGVMYIDIRDYGAVCNANYYNETSQKWYEDSGHTIEATDDYLAIVAAINASSQLNAKHVLISGRCLTSQPIQLYEDLTIEGLTCGVNHWCSIVSNTDIEKILYYEPAIQGSSHNIIIKNLRFYGYHSTYGIKFNGGGEGFKIYNCGFFKFLTGAGIYGYGSHASTYLELIIAHGNKDGILISGNGLVTILKISGDLNTSLVHFNNCGIGMCAKVVGIKSEQNQYPVYIDTCDSSNILLENIHCNVQYSGGDEYCINAVNSTTATIIINQFSMSNLSGMYPFVVDSVVIIDKNPLFSYTLIANFVYSNKAITGNYVPNKKGFVTSINGMNYDNIIPSPNLKTGFYTATAYLYTPDAPSTAIIRSSITGAFSVYLPQDLGNSPSNNLTIVNKSPTYAITLRFAGSSATIENTTQFSLQPNHTVVIYLDSTNNNWVVVLDVSNI